MEYSSDEQIYGNSAFSSESDDAYEDHHRSGKKKVKAHRSKSVEITENLPPRRNNENNNRNNPSYTHSNASTLIQINDDNKTPPVKKKSFSSKLFSKISNLFWWKKKKEIVTLTKEDKKRLKERLKKKKKKRNCCLIIILIIIIIILLGNIAALDVAYAAYRNSPLSNISNITTLVNNATNVQEQNLKSTMCSTILGAMPPKEYNCDFCWDVNSFPNVTNFCMLQSIYINAFNQTMFNAVGWMRDLEYCRWVGIKCDSSNNIIGINLKFPVVPRVFDSRIGRLKPLQKLTIIGGLVNGESVPVNVLPSGIFQLENLQELELTSTGFRGNIPNTFDKMTSLTSLRIVDNRLLTGPMPDTISSTSLIRLVYAMQNLTGPFPDFIGSSPSLQQSLQFMDLSSNLLTGNVPDSLANLTKLVSFSVASNLLTGEFLSLVPTSKFAKILILLNLSENNFTGIIPPAIVQCESLNAMTLSGNSFSGPIPAELGKLPLADLQMSFNKLTGNIPDSIGNLNLQRLLLSDNQLTGTIPNNICQREYYSCFLRFNNQIPAQTCVSCT